MALELKQSMRLSQQLVITPQLQQAIKLLQLSRIELQEVVQQELTENPLLEEQEPEPGQEAAEAQEAEAREEPAADAGGESEATADGADGEEIAGQQARDGEVEECGSKDGELKEPQNFDWENYLDIYNSPWPSSSQAPANSEGPAFDSAVRTSETLQEHLHWQLSMAGFSASETAIAGEIIGNINDDGYLTASADEIATSLGLHPGLVGDCLAKIQQFDPAGVGARTLQECLTLQIRQLRSPDEALLVRIIHEHMKELERHHYSQIAKKLKISADTARTLAGVIHALEPKPGRPYFQDTAQYITPDVYVQKRADTYEVLLNDEGLPRLQVSNFYRRTLLQGQKADPQAKEYLQNKLRSAMWLIKSIHQRQQTLYKVASSIVKFQREFLDDGIEGLRPMILRDVAEDIGMHESTVSRVTTNKYMHTPRGIFELKYFFNNGVQQTGGNDVASETVRQRIAQLIHSEDPKHPLSDQHIVSLLKQDRILIARRTVAKYREGLAIPSSSQRRRLE